MRRGAFAIEPEVTVDNNLSRRYTVVEVSGLDRPGLLRDLTASLSSLNLNIGSAHIVTFGEKAVDSFYVTDLTGQKINAPARQAAIKRRLLADFADGLTAVELADLQISRALDFWPVSPDIASQILMGLMKR